MELNAGLLSIADSLGIDESFCPVRAMLGAFVSEAHFPIPDLLVCSVGATCDDFSAIAQRLNGMGFPVFWWEIPHRRVPEQGEARVRLPGGFEAPVDQVDFVKSELRRVADAMEVLAGHKLADQALSAGIREANRVRRCLARLRSTVFCAQVCPLPALELLVAEMLAIHFCSNRDESLRVLSGLLDEVRRRVKDGEGFLGKEAVRVFWVNPVADLRVMNLLEECGGRICGTEYLFTHALDEIPEDLAPMDALARMALADPMIGPASDRARRVCRDASRFGAEAVVISRIPGASHCASEGRIIGETVRERLGIPVLELEVPPVSDALEPGLKTRLGALVETVKCQRTEG
jgi:benzoyl-CoA reductase/2-hydroxyglutaryl-CoA dehydratase subunit BcrC/BadD/HgdB